MSLMARRLSKTLREQAQYHRNKKVPDMQSRHMHDFFAEEYDRLAQTVEGAGDD